MTRRGAVASDYSNHGIAAQQVIAKQDKDLQLQSHGNKPSQLYWPGEEAALSFPGESLAQEGGNPERSSPIFYRALCPEDYHSLRLGHLENFPIDYEDAFFEEATVAGSKLLSWAAVQRQDSQQALVGFITAKYLKLHECDPTDRAAFGLSSRLLDSQEVVYILTLGVAKGARRRGVAKQLLRLVLSAARIKGCRTCFLHVITYNSDAINFYLANSFHQLAHRRDFYHISSGRQPDPSHFSYDAHLFACELNEEAPPSAMAYVHTALIPFRHLMESWADACGSWYRHGSPSSQPPHLLQQATRTKPPPTSVGYGWLHNLFSRQPSQPSG